MSKTGHQLDSKIREKAIEIFGPPTTGKIRSDEFSFPTSGKKSTERDERRFAVLYEYARESLSVRTFVEKIRHDRAQKLSRSLNFSSTWKALGSFLFGNKDFPETPWAGLDKQKRISMSQAYFSKYEPATRYYQERSIILLLVLNCID